VEALGNCPVCRPLNPALRCLTACTAASARLPAAFAPLLVLFAYSHSYIHILFVQARVNI